MSTTYAVTGMTCGHCAHAVTTEVEAIEGVHSVSVDVDAGKLTVEGENFTDEQVAAAVDEAGYAVAGAAAGDDDGRARAEEKVAEASAAITRLLKS